MPACSTLLIVALLAIAWPSRAEETAARKLAFDQPGWELEGEGTTVESFDGELALRLVSGRATYRDLEFQDGTIEFDLQVTEHRSFAYLYFRIESDGQREEYYFRPHKSGLPDAIQYTPVYDGWSQWQLYHDAGSTAAATFAPGEWIPIKVVVQGGRAAVFVGASGEPQIVSSLARSPVPGYLALRAFRPLGAPPDTYMANFANVVVRPEVVEYDFPAPETASEESERIPAWQISKAFAPEERPVLELPEEVLADAEWRWATSRKDGLVELELHAERPEGVRRASVMARARLVAETAGSRRVDLGYSDEVSVFLNGRLLAIDDESYSFNFPRRQGLWSADQLSLMLPLEEGANELTLVVTDRFGGWAVSGRLEPSSGVRVEAPE